MQVFIGQRRLKLIKAIHHLIHLLTKSSKMFVLFSVAPTVCVSRVFVYDAVNVNKIVIISSTKLPSYPYAQVATGLTLYLG